MAESYPTNSNKAKETSLIREPVMQAQDVRNDQHPVGPQQNTTRRPRKLSPVKEVFRAVFPGGVEELKEHVVWDIFVPWMQDMLRSAWQGLGDVIFPGSNRGSSVKRPPERYSYDSPYRASNVVYPATNTYDAGYYTEMRPMRSKDEAEMALRDLRDILMRYRVVTLLDYNERVGLPTRPTQNNYGWLTLDSAYVKYTNGGWVIKMPRAVAIDNYRQ